MSLGGSMQHGALLLLAALALAQVSHARRLEEEPSALVNAPKLVGEKPVDPDSICGGIDTCGECVAERQCGWCAHTQKCIPGKPDAPKAGNGTCPLYEYGICRSEPCKHYTGCSACLADPLCGWCASSGLCTEGHPEKGPLLAARSCPTGWCHSPRFSQRRETYVHAALDPEIDQICDNGCAQPGATGATGAAQGEDEDDIASMPDIVGDLINAQEEGEAVVEKAANEAASRASKDVPEQYRAVVAKGVREAVEQVSLSPQEKAEVEAKARADLVAFERARMDKVRDFKARVEGEKAKVEELLRAQEGDWPRAIEEASTVIRNMLQRNATLVGGDAETKQWAGSVRKFLDGAAARVAHSFGDSSPETARTVEASEKAEKAEEEAAAAGVDAEMGGARFRAVRSRLAARGDGDGDGDGAGSGALPAGLAQQMSAEEAEAVANLAPPAGQGQGRLSSLKAQLAAQRVLEGRRAAKEAESDAESYEEEAHEAKEEAMASAKRELAGAARMNDTAARAEVKRSALTRLEDAELTYREAQAAVRSALAKVKQTLAGDNADMMESGEHMVEEMAAGDLTAAKGAKEKEEEDRELEHQKEVKAKMARREAEEEKEEEELASIEAQTDERSAEHGE